MISKQTLLAKTALYLGSACILAMAGCAGGTGDSVNELMRLKGPELVVPPEYKLRPPEAGMGQPSEILREPGASQTFGINFGVSTSEIEKALVVSANAVAINPVIRGQIDYEEAATIRKSQSVTDNIREFASDDAAQDFARADVATGGDIVTIGSTSKLPGT